MWLIHWRRWQVDVLLAECPTQISYQSHTNQWSISKNIQLENINIPRLYNMQSHTIACSQSRYIELNRFRSAGNACTAWCAFVGTVVAMHPYAHHAVHAFSAELDQSSLAGNACTA